MEVSVLVDDEFLLKVDPVFLKQVAELVLDNARHDQSVEMGLMITGDEQVRQLNSIYRGINQATDVLSFAMADKPALDTGDPFAFTWPDDDVEQLGEVIISFPQAVQQAEEHGCSIACEIAMLVIHGTLHLLGYDHEIESEAVEMEKYEEILLNKIQGIET